MSGELTVTLPWLMCAVIFSVGVGYIIGLVRGWIAGWDTALNLVRDLGYAAALSAQEDKL